ncbi:MAG: hypothetical protein ACTHKV_14870 [Flavipsychrobacter sp.]
MSTETLISSWEEAAAKKGIDPNALPDVSMIPEHLRKFVVAVYKAAIITEVLNDGWQPNWEDDDEYKYYPWFDMNDASAPARFSFHVYDYDRTFSNLGSRLVFKTRQLAVHAGETFIDIYRDMMVIEKGEQG